MPVPLLVLLVYRITEHGPRVGHASGLAVGILAEEKAKLLKKIKAYKIEKAVETVTCSAVKIEESADVVFKESAEYRFVPVRADGTKINDQKVAMKDGKGKKVVLWDFGAKANIRRELLKRGLDVVTVPGTATAKEIMALNPDGIMLSNGPGDPAENVGIIAEIKKLVKTGIPIFGICLGHQLLALLYLQDGKLELAKKSLRNAGRIDANNTTTLRYLKEVNTQLKEKSPSR